LTVLSHTDEAFQLRSHQGFVALFTEACWTASELRMKLRAVEGSFLGSDIRGVYTRRGNGARCTMAKIGGGNVVMKMMLLLESIIIIIT